MSVPVQFDQPAILRVLSGINPLLATKTATGIHFYDKKGDLMAAFFLSAVNGPWLFVSKGDDDWDFHRSLVDPEGMPLSPNAIRIVSGRRPELEATLATVIEVYDRRGQLSSLFFRQFAEDLWVFAKPDDEDWRSNLVRLGYEKSDAKPYEGGVLEG